MTRFWEKSCDFTILRLLHNTHILLFMHGFIGLLREIEVNQRVLADLSEFERFSLGVHV